MSHAVLFALLGAGLNSANDLVYWKSAIGRSVKVVYLFYFFSSLFSAVFALLSTLLINGSFVIETVDVLYGILLGVLSFCAYILFLFSFSGSNTSVSVTIYRLNLIPGIILAVIFLDETISWRRGLGVILCVVSMLLFAGKLRYGLAQKKPLLLSLGACILGGVLNLLNKVAMLHGADSARLLFWRFLAVSLISGVILWTKRPARPVFKDIKYAMLSGLLLMLAVLSILTALKTGAVSVIIPITQMAFVIVALISWAFLGEKMTKTKLAGILCAIFAVILIS